MIINADKLPKSKAPTPNKGIKKLEFKKNIMIKDIILNGMKTAKNI